VEAELPRVKVRGGDRVKKKKEGREKWFSKRLSVSQKLKTLHQKDQKTGRAGGEQRDRGRKSNNSRGEGTRRAIIINGGEEKKKRENRMGADGDLTPCGFTKSKNEIHTEQPGLSLQQGVKI